VLGCADTCVRWPLLQEEKLAEAEEEGEVELVGFAYNASGDKISASLDTRYGNFLEYASSCHFPTIMTGLASIDCLLVTEVVIDFTN
jgi:hypothetical protein